MTSRLPDSVLAHIEQLATEGKVVDVANQPSNESSVICGAPTSNGTPCGRDERFLDASGFCWQHRADDNARETDASKRRTHRDDTQDTDDETPTLKSANVGQTTEEGSTMDIDLIADLLKRGVNPEIAAQFADAISDARVVERERPIANGEAMDGGETLRKPVQDVPVLRSASATIRATYEFSHETKKRFAYSLVSQDVPDGWADYMPAKSWYEDTHDDDRVTVELSLEPIEDADEILVADVKHAAKDAKTWKYQYSDGHKGFYSTWIPRDAVEKAPDRVYVKRV